MDFACQQTFTRLPCPSPKVLAQQGADASISRFRKQPEPRRYALSLDTGSPLRSTQSLTDSRFGRMVQMYYICTRTMLRKLWKVLSERTTSGRDAESLQRGRKLI